MPARRDIHADVGLHGVGRLQLISPPEAPLCQAVLGSATVSDNKVMGGAAELVKGQWTRLNQIWVGFFLLVGAINLYVAYSYSEEFWVKFKLFGMLGITIVFVIIQSVWLTMAAQKNESAQGDSEA